MLTSSLRNPARLRKSPAPLPLSPEAARRIAEIKADITAAEIAKAQEKLFWRAGIVFAVVGAAFLLLFVGRP